jgi:hypothetical protein
MIGYASDRPVVTKPSTVTGEIHLPVALENRARVVDLQVQAAVWY